MQLQKGAWTATAFTFGLLIILVMAALILLRRPAERTANPVYQDIPAPLRAIGAAAPDVHLSKARPKRPASSTSTAGHSGDALGAGAANGELQASDRAIRQIENRLKKSDLAAEQLKSQVARQDETIAAQKQALAAQSATKPEQGDAIVRLAAAVQTNDMARASLARYETMRSALLQQLSLLKQRNVRQRPAAAGKAESEDGAIEAAQIATSGSPSP